MFKATARMDVVGSVARRLVLKDTIMMGAALLVMADSAKSYLRRRDATSQAKRKSPQ
jgi:uncharacterized membrane protein YkgB